MGRPSKEPPASVKKKLRDGNYSTVILAKAIVSVDGEPWNFPLKKAEAHLKRLRTELHGEFARFK